MSYSSYRVGLDDVLRRLDIDSQRQLEIYEALKGQKVKASQKASQKALELLAAEYVKKAPIRKAAAEKAAQKKARAELAAMNKKTLKVAPKEDYVQETIRKVTWQ